MDQPYWRRFAFHKKGVEERLKKAKQKLNTHSITNCSWKDYWHNEVLFLEKEKNQKINKWKKYGFIL